MTLVLRPETTRRIIEYWKTRDLPYGLQRLLGEDLSTAFTLAVQKEGDLCPFCGMPTKEFSFASSYGQSNTSTWIVELFCSNCNLSKRIHSSTHIHQDA